MYKLSTAIECDNSALLWLRQRLMETTAAVKVTNFKLYVLKCPKHVNKFVIEPKVDAERLTTTLQAISFIKNRAIPKLG